MDDLSDDELLAELGVDVASQKKAARSPRDERILAGFEDIQRFVEEHGRAPQHGEGRDIFERLYAVRLDRMRELEECRDLLAGIDKQELISGVGTVVPGIAESMDDDELLAELGIDAETPTDIGILTHVKPRADVRAAEEIANRTKCSDFEMFKPLFAQVQKDLESGTRKTRSFELKSEIEAGRFFVVGGQKAFVAEKGDVFTNDQGRLDARLRVIFDNGTESRMLMRSLQRSLHKDDAGRRITEPSAGPLFGDEAEEADTESGTIYVLRSKSDHPTIAANREIIHKIGVTGGDLTARIAAAKNDPTFLLADVDIVATYELFNINRTKLEGLIHTFFSSARLDLQLNDRFGIPFKPREWFLAPIFVIDEAVSRIRDGTISKFQYDLTEARLVERP